MRVNLEKDDTVVAAGYGLNAEGLFETIRVVADEGGTSWTLLLQVEGQDDYTLVWRGSPKTVMEEFGERLQQFAFADELLGSADVGPGQLTTRVELGRTA